MFSETLKKWIEMNVRNKYHGDVWADIDLFEKSLLLKSREFELEGINEILPRVLEELPGSNLDGCKERMDRIIKIEPYLRHLFIIISPERYEMRPKDEIGGMDENRWTLAPLLKQAFAIVPMEYNLSSSKPDYINFSYKSSYQIVYSRRNDQSHNFSNLSWQETLELLTSSLVVYLDIAHHLGIHIKEAYSKEMANNGLSAMQYCKNIVHSYDLETKRGFTYVDVKWKASNSNIREYSTVETMFEEPGNNLVKILGEAGCGKTTIMKRLEYLGAKKYISNMTDIIPVFIPLGSIESNSSVQMDIKAIIKYKLNITDDVLNSLLESNLIRLFLDGFNEILDIKTKKQIAWSINNLSETFPEMKVFLSDRSLVRSPIKVLEDAIEYKLFPLDTVTKELFIESNCHDKQSKELLLSCFHDNPNYFESFSTPIKLKQLIELTNAHKKIPDDFDAEYISFIFERELIDKKDNNAEYLEDFACALALELNKNDVSINTDQQSGLPVKFACACFANCKNKLGYSKLDSLECLNLLIDIGILTNEEGLINFKYTSYKDHFWMLSFDNDLESLLED